LHTDIGFNLKPPQALYLVLRRSDVDSPKGQKWPMIQLKLRCSTANTAEIFTRGVSRQDHSSLKFSAQKTHSKWEIIFEGGLHYPSFSFGSSLIKWNHFQLSFCLKEKIQDWLGFFVKHSTNSIDHSENKLWWLTKSSNSIIINSFKAFWYFLNKLDLNPIEYLNKDNLKRNSILQLIFLVHDNLLMPYRHAHLANHTIKIWLIMKTIRSICHSKRSRN
jgi:hypothetical protein